MKTTTILFANLICFIASNCVYGQNVTNQSIVTSKMATHVVSLFLTGQGGADNIFVCSNNISFEKAHQIVKDIDNHMDCVENFLYNICQMYSSDMRRQALAEYGFSKDEIEIALKVYAAKRKTINDVNREKEIAQIESSDLTAEDYDNENTHIANFYPAKLLERDYKRPDIIFTDEEYLKHQYPIELHLVFDIYEDGEVHLNIPDSIESDSYYQKIMQRIESYYKTSSSAEFRFQALDKTIPVTSFFNTEIKEKRNKWRYPKHMELMKDKHTNKWTIVNNEAVEKELYRKIKDREQARSVLHLLCLRLDTDDALNSISKKKVEYDLEVTERVIRVSVGKKYGCTINMPYIFAFKKHEAGSGCL